MSDDPREDHGALLLTLKITGAITAVLAGGAIVIGVGMYVGGLRGDLTMIDYRLQEITRTVTQLNEGLRVEAAARAEHAVAHEQLKARLKALEGRRP